MPAGDRSRSARRGLRAGGGRRTVCATCRATRRRAVSVRSTARRCATWSMGGGRAEVRKFVLAGERVAVGVLAGDRPKAVRSRLATGVGVIGHGCLSGEESFWGSWRRSARSSPCAAASCALSSATSLRASRSRAVSAAIDAAVVVTGLWRDGGWLLLAGAQVLDPRSQLWVAVEEVDRHARGARDRPEVDLRAGFDQLAKRDLRALGRGGVLGLRRVAQHLGSALSAHRIAPRCRRSRRSRPAALPGPRPRRRAPPGLPRRPAARR